MYIGLGGEIRATVKTLGDLNQVLNGPQTNANDGVMALAQAIRASTQVAPTSTQVVQPQTGEV